MDNHVAFLRVSKLAIRMRTNRAELNSLNATYDEEVSCRVLDEKKI